MGDVSEKDMGCASAFFPLAGLVQGLLLCVSAFLLLNVFQAEPANGLLLLVLVVTNGGFHLDGLADTFDAVASGGDKEKKLAIMKDSTTGPVGVIAIVLAVLLKYLLLNALFFNSHAITYYSSLVLMPVFSRWTMVAAIFHAKSARQDGLGKIFIENTGPMELAIATLLTLSFSVAVPYTGNRVITGIFCCSGLSPLFLLAMPVLYVFSIVCVWFSAGKFGGMTGDTFGAVSEVSEILFLMVMVTWPQGFI